jgi:DNA polymerase-3 subunit epsilon
MADAEVAAALLGRIRDDLRIQFKVAEPKHALLMKLQACTRKAVPKAIEKHLAGD